MREERGRIVGDVLIYEPFELWGSISGRVRVIEHGKFYLRGVLYGNLAVEFGGRVHVFGNISGNLTVERGAKVILSGTVGGDVINRGGRLYIDSAGKIMGRLKTRKGETMIEPGARVPE